MGRQIEVTNYGVELEVEGYYHGTSNGLGFRANVNPWDDRRLRIGISPLVGDEVVWSRFHKGKHSLEVWYYTPPAEAVDLAGHYWHFMVPHGIQRIDIHDAQGLAKAFGKLKVGLTYLRSFLPGS